MTDTPQAADGRALPTAFTFAQFLQLMEDGEFHAEISDALRLINEKMNQHVIDHGGTAKGKLTITVDFSLNKGVFEIKGDFAVKIPKPPRGKTVLWGTAENRFSPANPKQMQMFGVREVADSTDGEARAI